MAISQNLAYGALEPSSQCKESDHNASHLTAAIAINLQHQQGNEALSNSENEYIKMNPIASQNTQQTNQQKISIQANTCYNSSADLLNETSFGDGQNSNTRGLQSNINENNSPTDTLNTPDVQSLDNSCTYEYITHTEQSRVQYEMPARSSPRPPLPLPPTDQHNITQQVSANVNISSGVTTSNAMIPNIPQPSIQPQPMVVQAPIHVQMQNHTPGIVQPVMVYYNSDYVHESVQKSNEGLCGRYWCCYSGPFCAAYSMIILIICFFIIGGPFTIFWSIPSAVLLILGAKKRNRTYIAIGMGIHICFGIWSFFILGPAWGWGLFQIIYSSILASSR